MEQRTHKEGSKHEFKGLLIQTNRMEKESTSSKFSQNIFKRLSQHLRDINKFIKILKNLEQTECRKQN
ncbi:hypothetical protein H5410_051892 [Solanum commersonii]|uniref:Uncharacterized protein n=1 Tax=Solanum commersonii TaxID=4109 RepID=A0A9J5WZC2_SOLCO|nr:hypothetical protein H5410_051892 [Solanum commersonii]